MNWNLAPEIHSEDLNLLISNLSGKESFPQPLAKLLIQRGINNISDAKAYFEPLLANRPSHWLMLGMQKAVERVILAITKKEKIVLYGDYDVDGTTSIALFKYFFEEIGYPVDYYVPDRFTEGYGLSYQGLETVIKNGVSLLIVMDCGTKEIEKCRFAKGKGIEMIICDHHTPGEQLPDCVAMLNPRQKECKYPFKDLSACGIVLKFVEALSEKIPEAGDALKKYGDLVALSIACDLVPLTGENRILAWHGLNKLRDYPLPGIRALKNLSKAEREWTIEDVIFFLGPRINSAGRKTHALHAVELLTGQPEILSDLADHLEESNEWRKITDTQITEEAIAMIEQNPEELNRKSTVLYKESWHKGVIGIVASRLIEKYYRPTVMITKSDNVWVGSARSVSGFDLYEALNECAEFLLQFGGHRYAAGLTIKEDQLDLFKARFEKIVSERIRPVDQEPHIEISSEVNFSYLNDKFVRLLNKMGPFGPENMEPIFLTRNVNVIETRILKEQHIRLVLEQNGIKMVAIAFNLAEKWVQNSAEKMDIVWQTSFNLWNSKRSIQLKIKDFKPIR